MIDPNPWRSAVIKYLRQLLGDAKAAEFVPVISRAMIGLPSKQDAIDFSKLIQTAYEQGFEKAFSQYQEKMKELGYNLTVKEKTQDKPVGTFEYKIK